MLIVPTSMFLAAGSGGSRFPVVTLGAAQVSGGAVPDFGYVRAGGLIAGSGEGYSAAGTLSDTLVPEFVTDAVFNDSSSLPNNDIIRIYIVGDCEALLAGITGLKVDGTTYSLEDQFFYNSEEGWTAARTVNGTYWTTTGDHIIQLV